MANMICGECNGDFKVCQHGRMTAIAARLSRIGDINEPPLRDALDYIRELIEPGAAARNEVTRLREALLYYSLPTAYHRLPAKPWLRAQRTLTPEETSND